MSMKYKLRAPSGATVFETDDKFTMYAFMFALSKGNDYETFVDMNFYVDDDFKPKTTFMWECAKEDFMSKKD